MINLRRSIALAGFLAGGAGAALEQPLMVWAAIALLSVALVLRLIAEFRLRRAASPSDSVSRPVDE
jgi:hypothetical protein